MIVHNSKHPLAGMEVTIKKGLLKDRTIRIDDWWDRATGDLWKKNTGSPEVLMYLRRLEAQAGEFPLPKDEDVVLGQVGGIKQIVHVLEFI